jgi:hypothetical protein
VDSQRGRGETGECVMVLRLAIGKPVLNVVSMYAPQVGRTVEVKDEFYILLAKFLKNVGGNEKLTMWRHEWACWSRSNRV